MPPTPLIIAASVLYTVMSLITALFYALDKRAARRRTRRTPESTLHLLELLGGWPGALIAQQLFKHKRRKRTYMAVFALIILLHLAAWAAAIYLANRP